MSIAKPPPGFRPIPGSRAHGWFRDKGAKREYWYPPGAAALVQAAKETHGTTNHSGPLKKHLAAKGINTKGATTHDLREMLGSRDVWHEVIAAGETPSLYHAASADMAVLGDAAGQHFDLPRITAAEWVPGTASLFDAGFAHGEDPGVRYRVLPGASTEEFTVARRIGDGEIETAVVRADVLQALMANWISMPAAGWLDGATISTGAPRWHSEDQLFAGEAPPALGMLRNPLSIAKAKVAALKQVVADADEKVAEAVESVKAEVPAATPAAVIVEATKPGAAPVVVKAAEVIKAQETTKSAALNEIESWKKLGDNYNALLDGAAEAMKAAAMAANLPELSDKYVKLTTIYGAQSAYFQSEAARKLFIDAKLAQYDIENASVRFNAHPADEAANQLQAAKQELEKASFLHLPGHDVYALKKMVTQQLLPPGSAAYKNIEATLKASGGYSYGPELAEHHLFPHTTAAMAAAGLEATSWPTGLKLLQNAASELYSTPKVTVSIRDKISWSAMKALESIAIKDEATNEARKAMLGLVNFDANNGFITGGGKEAAEAKLAKIRAALPSLKKALTASKSKKLALWKDDLLAAIDEHAETSLKKAEADLAAAVKIDLEPVKAVLAPYVGKLKKQAASAQEVYATKVAEIEAAAGGKVVQPIQPGEVAFDGTARVKDLKAVAAKAGVGNPHMTLGSDGAYYPTTDYGFPEMTLDYKEKLAAAAKLIRAVGEGKAKEDPVLGKYAHDVSSAVDALVSGHVIGVHFPELTTTPKWTMGTVTYAKAHAILGTLTLRSEPIKKVPETLFRVLDLDAPTLAKMHAGGLLTFSVGTSASSKAFNSPIGGSPVLPGKQRVHYVIRDAKRGFNVAGGGGGVGGEEETIVSGSYAVEKIMRGSPHEHAPEAMEAINKGIIPSELKDRWFVILRELDVHEKGLLGLKKSIARSVMPEDLELVRFPPELNASLEYASFLSDLSPRRNHDLPERVDLGLDEDVQPEPLVKATWANAAEAFRGRSYAMSAPGGGTVIPDPTEGQAPKRVDPTLLRASYQRFLADYNGATELKRAKALFARGDYQGLDAYLAEVRRTVPPNGYTPAGRSAFVRLVNGEPRSYWVNGAVLSPRAYDKHWRK